MVASIALNMIPVCPLQNSDGYVSNAIAAFEVIGRPCSLSSGLVCGGPRRNLNFYKTQLAVLGSQVVVLIILGVLVKVDVSIETVLVIALAIESLVLLDRFALNWVHWTVVRLTFMAGRTGLDISVETILHILFLVRGVSAALS